MAQITKQGKNSYLIRVSCGYDRYGKQRTKSKTWKAPSGVSKREEKRLLADFVVDFENRVLGGGYAKAVTFEELAKQWLEIAEHEVKHSTIEHEKDCLKKACEWFGYMRVDKITAYSLQEYVNDYAKTHAPSTTRADFEVVSNIMGYAYKIGMIKENPCRRVTMPKRKETEKEILTVEEMSTFLDYVTENLPLIQQAFFMLAIFCGMRKGEVLGLKWSDIDFDNARLHINRTAYYTKARGTYTDTPKTKKSQRTVAISDSVLDLLSHYHEKQEQIWETEWLFTLDGNKLISSKTPSLWLDKACEKAGVKRVTPHSFRHFYASLLIGEGEDVSTVSACLGHSNVTTTLNTYTHAFEDKKRAANMKVAEILKHKTEYVNLEKVQ